MRHRHFVASSFVTVALVGLAAVAAADGPRLVPAPVRPVPPARRSVALPFPITPARVEARRVPTPAPRPTPPTNGPTAPGFSLVPGTQYVGAAMYMQTPMNIEFLPTWTTAVVQFPASPRANVADGGVRIVFKPTSAVSKYEIRCLVAGSPLYDVTLIGEYDSTAGDVKQAIDFSYSTILPQASIPAYGGMITIEYPGLSPLPDDVSLFLTAKSVWTFMGCWANVP